MTRFKRNLEINFEMEECRGHVTKRLNLKVKDRLTTYLCQKLLSFYNIGLGKQILDIFYNLNFWTTLFCRNGPNFCHSSSLKNLKFLINLLEKIILFFFVYPKLVLHNRSHAKGQLISKGNFGVFNSSKKRTWQF